MTKGYAAPYWGRGQRFGLADIGHGRAYWWGTKDIPAGASGSRRLGKERIAGLFAGWADEAQEAIRVTPEVTIVSITARDRPFLQRWGTGRMTPLGDAAHPMLVSLGQGAALTIEDAVVLAEHLKGATELPSALAGLRGPAPPRGNSAKGAAGLPGGAGGSSR
ncbi:FAD-dependent monooxygenase [Streptomyces noursei]|uniref:FAD-dependent monooxygenase n=1 Tax=Streptomyces noursei TaxID=1971 RepID=UPI003800E678